MKVQAVQSASASSAREVGMEMWRMSMTQRLSADMRERITGRGSDRKEPRRVEPAVRIDISEQARRVAKEQQA